MGLRVVSAPVLLDLSCGHADGCSGELRITLDPSKAEPFAVAEGIEVARGHGWTIVDGPSVRFLPKVYCLKHAAG